MMGLAQSMLFADGALGRATKELIVTFVSRAIAANIVQTAMATRCA